GQHKGALELAGGDAAMKVGALAVFALPAPDDELVLLDGDVEFLGTETGHRQGDQQTVAGGLAVARQALDVIGRVTVSRGLRGPVEQTLELIEAQQERTVKVRNP